MLTWIAQNTLVAGGIALATAICSLLLQRRPAACHVLWLCALVALVAPPLPRHGALDGRAHARRLAAQAAATLSTIEIALIDPAPAEPGAGPSGDTRGAPAAQKPPHPSGMESRAREHASAREAKLMEKWSRRSDASASDPAQYAPVMEPDPVPAAPAGAPVEASDKFSDRSSGFGATWLPDVDWRGAALRLLVGAWLAGAAVAVARSGREVLRVRRLVHASAEPDPTFVREVHEAARAVGAPRPLVRISGDISTPFVWAAPRGSLIWPAGQGLDDPGARAVLAHELAHLARRDHLLAWVEALALCALWWHPLAHLIRGQLRRHAERACDAWVVWAYPEHRRDYADALLDAVERLSRIRRPAPVLGAVDTDRRSLTRRLIMIMNENVARRGSRLLAAGAVALTAVLTPTWAVSPRAEFPLPVALDADIDAPLQPLLEAARLRWQAKVYAGGEDHERAAAALAELAVLRPDDAQLAHQLAAELYAAEEYRAASETYAKSADLNPSDPDLLYNRACCLALEGDQAGALTALEGALARGYRDGAHAQEDGDLESIHKHAKFRDIAARMGDLGDVWEQAENALSEEEWSDAASAFATAAELAPECAELRHYLGFTAFRDGDLDTARAAFERAMQMGFSEGTCLYNLACVATAAGQEHEALALLEQSIAAGFADPQLMSEDPDLEPLHKHEAFASALERMSQPAELKRELQTAMEANEWSSAAKKAQAWIDTAGDDEWSRGWALDQLGIAMFKVGDYESAEKAFSLAAASHYDLADSLYNIACCRTQAGDSDGAIEYLTAAVEAGFAHAEHMRTDEDIEPIRSDPRFESIVRLAGDREVLAQFGAPTWEELLDRSKSEIAEDPEDGAAHLRLGWALLRMGRIDEAMEAFAQQADLGFAPGIAHYNIACCHAIEGRADDAFASLDDAVEEGFDQFELMAEDPDLASLRADSRFKKLTASSAKDKTKEKAEKVEKADKVEETTPEPDRRKSRI